jgi:hypothetical protein
MVKKKLLFKVLSFNFTTTKFKKVSFLQLLVLLTSIIEKQHFLKYKAGDKKLSIHKPETPLLGTLE